MRGTEKAEARGKISFVYQTDTGMQHLASLGGDDFTVALALLDGLRGTTARLTVRNLFICELARFSLQTSQRAIAEEIGRGLLRYAGSAWKSDRDWDILPSNTALLRRLRHGVMRLSASIVRTEMIRKVLRENQEILKNRGGETKPLILPTKPAIMPWR